MNIWLVVGGLGVLLMLVVLIGTRRPRRIEDELARPTTKSPSVDGPSSLVQAAGLLAVLRSIKARRQSGTLQVTASDRTASVYFLFGHLFHATSGALTGEPALQECLSWTDFRITFDSKAKLPTEETIERPTDEVLA